ncbi:zinc finger CCCH domain-containing protein 34-like [Nymphaea colorata]|uniref:zinc finger CCCH domain-containing protein 34-like n=1 Tax=Nymphaea colorata TaxID=210225 RepID=UPI00129E8A35|nr:zinc finger CCCH domain-containing protein 34-like [Nymphaea colorata]
MEDEFLKRNTDCVYFLASPLTCKKGGECEFRHSEGARLNPRDCWYWLQGNCLNPHCAFRHPPLDAWTETSSEYLPALQLPPLPKKPKSSVPCYFYSSGHCIKGDQCPFMHGPNGIQPSEKLEKVAEGNSTGNQLENKAPTVTSAEPDSSSPPNRTSTPLKVPHTSCLKKSDIHDDGVSETERCSSPQACAPEADDSTVRSSKSLLPEEDDYVSLQPDLLECSEDHMNGTEREEWWESSPGLDVLVDDESEFEEDVKYTLLRDRGVDQFHRRLLQHDYEDAGRFEHYSEAELPRRHVTFDGYEATEYVYDSMQRTAMQFRVRMPEQLVPYGRRRVRQYETEGGYRNSVDLRDHLKKRRTDYGRFGYYSGDHPHLLHKSDTGKGQQGRCISVQKHERMSSQVAKNRIVQYSKADSNLRSNKKHGRSGHAKSRHVKRQEHDKLKRKPNFTVRSEIARGQCQNDIWSTQKTDGFAGPKSLSQIKEEKKRVRESEDGLKCLEQNDCANWCRDMSHQFQGPKSLNELLKDKIRPKSLDKAIQLTTTISVDSVADCRSSLHRDTREHKNGYINDGNSGPDEEADGASNRRVAEKDEFSDAHDDDDDFLLKLESMYS